MKLSNKQGLRAGSIVRFSITLNGEKFRGVGRILHKATKTYSIEATFEGEAESQLCWIDAKDITKIINEIR